MRPRIRRRPGSSAPRRFDDRVLVAAAQALRTAAVDEDVAGAKAMLAELSGSRRDAQRLADALLAVAVAFVMATDKIIADRSLCKFIDDVENGRWPGDPDERTTP
jgi:hypothetical protein